MATYYVTNDLERNTAERIAPDWSTILLARDGKFGAWYIDNDKLAIRGQATIDADGKPYGIMIAADNVSIYGLSITGSSRSGISIQNSSDVKVSSVELYDNDKLGYYAVQSDRLTLQDSTIFGNAIGGVSVHVPKFHGKAGFINVLGNDIFGNGIEGDRERWPIIADYDFWRRDLPEYHPKFMVKGNTIHDNGASTLAFHADNFHFVDNESYNNNLKRPGLAELRFYDSHRNTVDGNDFGIAVGHRIMSFEAGSTAVVGKNVVTSYTEGEVKGLEAPSWAEAPFHHDHNWLY